MGGALLREVGGALLGREGGRDLRLHSACMGQLYTTHDTWVTHTLAPPSLCPLGSLPCASAAAASAADADAGGATGGACARTCARSC